MMIPGKAQDPMVSVTNPVDRQVVLVLLMITEDHLALVDSLMNQVNPQAQAYLT